MKIFSLLIFAISVMPQRSLSADAKYYLAVKEVIEEVRPDPTLKEIEEFLNAAPVINPDIPLEKKADQIAKYIFVKAKIGADNSYQSRNNKDNILPDSVLRAKQGHCVGLTLLFLLVAEKNKLKVQLVRVPDHVFPRLCAQDKCINVEMLKSGELRDDSFYIKNLLIPKIALEKKLYLVGLDTPNEIKASIYLGLGFVANKGGQRDIAELFYSKAAKSSDKFAEPHSNLAAIYAESGDLEKANKELKLALDINPSHYASLINLAVIEEAQGQKERAFEHFNQAIEINPVSVDAYRRRSKIYFDRKDWRNAVLDLDRILIIEPRSCDILEERIKTAKQDPKLIKPSLDNQLKNLKAEKKCRNVTIN